VCAISLSASVAFGFLCRRANRELVALEKEISDGLNQKKKTKAEIVKGTRRSRTIVTTSCTDKLINRISSHSEDCA